MQKSFLTKQEIKALNLSPREVGQANGAHAEMLRNLSQRAYKAKRQPRKTWAERMSQATGKDFS